MEAIIHLECKLNMLTLKLHPSAPPEPLDEVLQQYRHFMYCTKENIFCEHSTLRYHNIQWQRLFTIRRLVN